jgi:hypothetical protein
MRIDIIKKVLSEGLNLKKQEKTSFFYNLPFSNTIYFDEYKFFLWLNQFPFLQDISITKSVDNTTYAFATTCKSDWNSENVELIGYEFNKLLFNDDFEANVEVTDETCDDVDDSIFHLNFTFYWIVDLYIPED